MASLPVLQDPALLFYVFHRGYLADNISSFLHVLPNYRGEHFTHANHSTTLTELLGSMSNTFWYACCALSSSFIPINACPFRK